MVWKWDTCFRNSWISFDSPNQIPWDFKFKLFMLFLISPRNGKLICNANLMIFSKTYILQFSKNISRLVLQIGFLLLHKVGKSKNNLNLNLQMIWSGESKDIYKFLKHVSNFQTIQKHSNMHLNFYFSISKVSLNTIFLQLKNSLWLSFIVLEI